MEIDDWMLMNCLKRSVFILLFMLNFPVIIPVLLFSQNVKENGKNADYDPRAAELVIQGAIFDLNGEYSKALIAYNEAFIYAPDPPFIWVRFGQICINRQSLGSVPFCKIQVT